MFIHLREALRGNPVFAVCWTLLAVVFLVPGAFAQGSSEEADEESDAGAKMRFDEDMAAIETGGYMTGEAVIINTDRNLLGLDNDRTEAPVIIKVNKKTTYTTVSSLSDIRPGDRVSVDYYSSGENKVAENIVLEERGSVGEKALPKLDKVLVD